MRPRAIVRLDDLGRNDPLRDSVVPELCRRGIKVTCAVVPLWLDQATVSLLQSIAIEFPGFVEINQHGYQHTDYSGGNSDDKYEFGANRSLEQQFSDILNGRRLLEANFGELFFPAFTPPYGNYDGNTLLALEAARFPLMSSLARDADNDLIPDLPTLIDCFEWGPTRAKHWSTVVREWNERAEDDPIGIVLHPRFMEPDSIDQFAIALEAMLKDRQSITFAEAMSSFQS